MASIAAICNFYNEANALPGWIESASQWADHITLFNCGPGGQRSNDGSIEIAEKWGVDLRFGSIDEGFGVVRTQLITMPPTDWVFILDGDERFHRFAPHLEIASNGVPQVVGVYDQGQMLREVIANPMIDAVVTSRRHWRNFHWDALAEDFSKTPDWQARIVRNCSHVVYRSDVKMHEKIIDTNTGMCPRWYHPEVAGNYKIFHDHYHCWMKQLEPDQRAHDVAIYDALDRGYKPPTLEEFERK